RECSIQRRYQKIIEESPSPTIDDAVRKKMGEAAVRIGKETKYNNAGTIEFMVDKNLNFYFLEMNTRIQVEHPITEEITGVDLVKKQIEIASGMPIGLKQEDIKIHGFAMECRINAEDPKNQFMPNSGRVTAYYSPGGIGVRIDGAVYRDYVIPGCYDSMIVKLIINGGTWEEVLARMDRALEEFVIRGVKTTIPYLRNIVNEEDFKAGNFDTGYIDRKPELMKYYEYEEPTDIVAAVSAAIAAYHGL
ncbi:MAG: acetyl-CoA carboxylase biotin carboxylase subunit, partial [Deltaproteobacteria bacterium]|nr:acetyl-CoA carboxylase biotin carboxylase subunit [Deltaproteobacteria bacterium]